MICAHSESLVANFPPPLDHNVGRQNDLTRGREFPVIVQIDCHKFFSFAIEVCGCNLIQIEIHHHFSLSINESNSCAVGIQRSVSPRYPEQ